MIASSQLIAHTRADLFMEELTKTVDEYQLVRKLRVEIQFSITNNVFGALVIARRD